jgi:hypothetical protein
MMRVFALLAGAFVATIDIKYIADKIPLKLNTILSFLFLGLLIYIATIEKTIPQYPNLFCLWVVLFTAFLIILGAAERKTAAFKFMSLKPFVFIGLISYSLYIWHWPIFAFARYVNISLTAVQFALLIILSIILATLSYKFIENPLRKLHTKVSFTKTLILLVLIPIMLTFHFNEKITKNMGYPERNPDYAQKTEYSIRNHDMDVCYNPQKINSETFSACLIGNRELKPSALLMGDSWSDHYTEMIDYMLNDANISGIRLASSSNLPFIDQQSVVNDQSFSDIADKKYKYVIIGNSLAKYLNVDKDNFADNFGKTVDFIVENGATPVFVTGLYDLIGTYSSKGRDFTRCGFRSSAGCEFDDNMLIDANELEFQAILASNKEKYPQIIIIDLHNLLCFEGKCSAVVDDYPLYSDKNSHITPYASKCLGEMYLDKYPNPFK